MCSTQCLGYAFCQYNPVLKVELSISLSLLSPAHTQRLLKLQSMLRRAPSYRTLELQLIEWQERELFEYFVVVSLKKKPTKNSFSPEVSYQFPKVRDQPNCILAPRAPWSWVREQCQVP